MDASAWIEYLFGTNAGARAAELVDNKENIIITPNIVLAEVVSKYARLGEDHVKALESIYSISTHTFEDRDVYARAGKRHAEIRKTQKSISLADCVVMEIAQAHDAKIITKDFHQKGKNSIYIG